MLTELTLVLLMKGLNLYNVVQLLWFTFIVRKNS